MILFFWIESKMVLQLIKDKHLSNFFQIEDDQIQVRIQDRIELRDEQRPKKSVI